MALVVLIDGYCTCWDIDARAAKEVKAGIAQTLSDICLALYTIELAMGFLVSGWNLFKDWAVSGPQLEAQCMEMMLIFAPKSWRRCNTLYDLTLKGILIPEPPY